MRQLLVLVTLVVINVSGYLLRTRPLVDGRARLELELEEREEELQVAKRQADRWIQLERVVGDAQAVLEPWQAPAKGDFSTVRTAILNAERGLALSRGAVEFRPDNRVIAGFRGVRVKATETGDFFSLWAFLERLSQWNAPVAPVEVTLAEDRRGVGLAKLTVTWVGLWPENGAPVDGNRHRLGVVEPPEELSPEALVHLEGWLRRVRQDEGVSPPQRDILRKVSGPDPVSEQPFVQPSSSETISLQLVGFIFSGGAEGEESHSAAVRFEGRMLLVKAGDSVGAYRVERLVVGEEIELLKISTSETIRLFLN